MQWGLPAPLFRGQRRHAHGVEASAERDAVAAHGQTTAHRLLQQGIEAPDLLRARPGKPRRHRIPVPRHREGPARETQHVGGRQPADVLVERLVSLMRGDLVLQVLRDHGPMERGPDLPPPDDRVERRGHQQDPAIPPVEARGEAHGVAADHEAPARFIPDDHREGAGQPLDEPVRPTTVRGGDERRVGDGRIGPVRRPVEEIAIEDHEVS